MHAPHPRAPDPLSSRPTISEPAANVQPTLHRHPNTPTCKICGTALDPHQAARGGICGAVRCQMSRVQEASRAVFQRDWDAYVVRQHRIVELSAPEIACAIKELDTPAEDVAIGVVPHQNRAVVPLPDDRRTEFATYLNEIAAKAMADPSPPAEPDAGRDEEADEHPLIGATCATCQGKCCILGGPSHAFLTAKDVHRFLHKHPGAGADDFRAHYLSRLPERSVEFSCVYHTETGCALTRAERADVCNRYHCNPQTQLLLKSREMKTDKMIIIAAEGEAGPVVAALDMASPGAPRRIAPDLEGASDPDDVAGLLPLIDLAKTRLPPEHHAKDQTRPGCAWCGADIDRHAAATTRSCGREACETARRKDLARDVAEARRKRHQGLVSALSTELQNEIAGAAELLGASSEALHIGAVPYQSAPLRPATPEQREAMTAHLRSIAKDGFARPNADAVAASASGAAEAVEAACSTCRGACCARGGPNMAFLGTDEVARFRQAHPSATVEDFVEHYLAHLPAASVSDACLYQSSQGCTIPREERSDTCNSFRCTGLSALIEALNAGENAPAVIIAQSDGRARAMGAFAPGLGCTDVPIDKGVGVPGT